MNKKLVSSKLPISIDKLIEDQTAAPLNIQRCLISVTRPIPGGTDWANRKRDDRCNAIFAYIEKADVPLSDPKTFKPKTLEELGYEKGDIAENATAVHFNPLLSPVGTWTYVYKTILRSKSTGKPFFFYMEYPFRKADVFKGVSEEVLFKLIEDIEKAWDGPVGQHSRTVVNNPDFLSSIMTVNHDTGEIKFAGPGSSK